MKRVALLLAVLLLVGCSAKTKAPPKQLNELPQQTQITVSEEAAVKAAKNADPRASVEGWAAWKAQLDKDVELEVDGKTQKHTVWVVEASHSDGENLVIYVTATVYPPKVLKVDKKNARYVTREQAIEASLQGTGNVEVKDATLVEKYPLEKPFEGRSEVAAWVVELVGKSDKQAAGTVIVDASTGRVISASNPPSGDLGRLNDQQKHLLDRLQAYSLDAESLWNEFQGPKESTKNDFATLSSATGMIWRDSRPNPLTLGKDRVERAIRLLSSTIQLGEGAPPSKDRVDYELEFTGLTPSATVVLSKNAAYFKGKVYYRPGLADWLRTNMNAN